MLQFLAKKRFGILDAALISLAAFVLSKYGVAYGVFFALLSAAIVTLIDKYYPATIYLLLESDSEDAPIIGVFDDASKCKYAAGEAGVIHEDGRVYVSSYQLNELKE